MSADAGPLRRPLQISLAQEPWSLGKAVVEALHAAGHNAVFVGGCVRDLLFDRRVKDVDVATDADPDRVHELFPNSLAVGKRFGVMVVPVGGGRFIEVASFRSDAAYVDGRRPSGIHLAEESDDVRRRDFTINALVVDPVAGELRDHVGGLADIDARLLRVVGDPTARLREDRLRVLRGLRFAAQLDLRIDPASWSAICDTAITVSRERVLEEWDKALGDERRAQWWALLREAGQLGALCPLLAEADLGELDRSGAALARLSATAPRDVALALCLLPVAEDVHTWLKEQPISRQRRERLLWLLQQRPQQAWTRAGRAERCRLLRHPDAVQLLTVWSAAHPDWPALPAIRAAHAAEQGRSWIPLLRAEDLLAMGIAQGPRIGELLRRVGDAQLAGEIADRSDALALARSLTGQR